MFTVTRVVRVALSAATIALIVSPSRAEADTTSTARRAARTDATSISCPPVARAGTYRISMKRDRQEPVLALLVLERAGGCLSAMLVTGQSSSALDILSFENDALTARVRSGSGNAKLSITFDEQSVSGTMEHRKKTWSVSGTRTS